MDKRIAKTKKALHEALLQLLKKQKLEDITVTKLCSAANINRNTFYFHYRGVYDLLNEIEMELIEEIKPFIGKAVNTSGFSPLESLCQVYYERKEILQTITAPGCDRSFSATILNLAKEPLMTTWTGMNQLSYRQAEKIYTFTVAGSISILTTWIQNGFPETPKEIAGFIEQASMAILDYYKEKED